MTATRQKRIAVFLVGPLILGSLVMAIAMLVLVPIGQIEENETNAILLLQDIATAMEEFRHVAIRDQDRDGQGEFGFLREIVLHSSNFPKLGESISRNDGIGKLYGYHIVLYLPHNPAPLRGQYGKDERRVEGANARELRYVVYAWPVEYGKTGRRAWTINQQGEVYATSNQTVRYSGLTHFPVPSAGLDTSQPSEPLNSPLGGWANVTGDGQIWTTS